MTLFDEAFQQHNAAASNRGFARLLDWAYDLTASHCNDPHLNDDVVMDAMTSVCRTVLSDAERRSSNTAVDIAHKIRSMILGFRSAKGREWRGLLADHLAARRRRREVPLDDATLIDRQYFQEPVDDSMPMSGHVLCHRTTRTASTQRYGRIWTCSEPRSLQSQSDDGLAAKLVVRWPSSAMCWSTPGLAQAPVKRFRRST